MHKRLLVLFAASALLLMACDVSGLVTQFLPQKEIQNAQATLQALEPTVGAVGTAAPAIQTAAPAIGKVIPTIPGATNPFAAALGKAKTATKYRIQFSWVFGGMDKGKYVEQPFIDLTGEMDGAKSHMTSKGGLLAMLASDPNTPAEFITADGKTYMKGVTLFGKTDPKLWYIGDDSMTSSFSDFAKPDEFSSWVSGAQPGDIKKARTETLDGQSCDVYAYDMKTMQNAGLGALLAMAQDKGDFAVVDKADVNVWLCGDGFVHKFVLDYEGHNGQDATQKAAMKMNWHSWDFNNAAIVITAPKDAKAMPK